METWRRSPLLLLVLVFALASEAADDPAADAAARVQRLFDEVAAVTGDAELSADAKQAQVAALISPFLDHPGLARAALGPNVKRFDHDEYSDFSHEYARFVTASLVRRFASYSGQAGSVEESRFDEERKVAIVVSHSAEAKPGYPGIRRLAKLEPLKIELALRMRHGEWRLAGLRRGGVDVGRTFREQFASMLEREDPAAVIAELRERNRKSDAENPFAENG